MRVRIVGPGWAGLSFSRAFTKVGWEVLEHLGRNDDLSNAAEGVDTVLLSVPDQHINEVKLFNVINKKFKSNKGSVKKVDNFKNIYMQELINK